MSNALYFLIGAAGVGKTSSAKQIDAERSDIDVCYFDKIGIPSHEEMVEQYGSGEEWQRAKTIEWTQIITDKYLPESDVVLDTQTRSSFIHEGVKEAGLENYKIVLFDCDDAERERRLAQRGQPELETDDMKNWAGYLRDTCDGDEYCTIIDTSKISIDEATQQLLEALDQ